MWTGSRVLRDKPGGMHTCTEFARVCLDQIALVMHADQYKMINGSQMSDFDISNIGVCS